MQLTAQRWVVLTVTSSILLAAPAASAAATSVTIAGSLQSELGCPGDWMPDCAATHLTQGQDAVWRGTWDVPAGSWEYKAALDDSWDVNYGANATQNGSNIPLALPDATSVRFYFDDASHWVTDNRTSVIAVAVGSFQSELGCAGDWDPGCLRSWLEDPSGSGTYSFTTTALPAGTYEAKVAIDEAWNENYGAGGAPNGANIAFTVPTANAPTSFSYDPVTHVLTITSETVVTIVGNLQTELGCASDWMPDCAATRLVQGPDAIWRGTWTIPAGSWEYKAALNDTWDVNYGANATANGSNLAFALPEPTSVRFYFDDVSHWVTDSRTSVIAVAVGDFQSELGCASDWDPACLRSWLEDPSGSGTYSFTTTSLPVGRYDAKVAIDESWNENYGARGKPNGSNIDFTVRVPNSPTTFSYDPGTHVLTIRPTRGSPRPRP